MLGQPGQIDLGLKFTVGRHNFNEYFLSEAAIDRERGGERSRERDGGREREGER